MREWLVFVRTRTGSEIHVAISDVGMTLCGRKAVEAADADMVLWAGRVCEKCHRAIDSRSEAAAL